MFNQKMVGGQLTMAKKWIVVSMIMLFTAFAFTVQADIHETADDLAVSLTVSPETARPGDDVVYAVVVDHTGSTEETVKITGSLLNMSGVVAYIRNAGDSSIQPTEVLNVTLADGLSWAGIMPPNTSISFVYTATLASTLEDQETIENVAQASIVGGDGASDSASVLIDTAGPLRASEFTAASGVATVGDSVEFTLSIENGGDNLIDDGMIQVSVPAEWTINTDSVPASVSGTGSAINVTDVSEDGITAELFINSNQIIDLTFSAMLDGDAQPNEISTLTAQLSDGTGNVAIKQVGIEKAGPLKDSALTVTNDVIGAGRDRGIIFTLSNDADGTDVSGSVEIVVDSALTLVASSVPTENINGTSSTIRDISVSGNTITANFAFLDEAELNLRFDVMADEDAAEGTEYTITAEIAQEGFNAITRDVMLTAGMPEQITYLPMLMKRLPIPPILSFEVINARDFKLLWSGVPRVQPDSTVRYLLQESNSATFSDILSEKFYTSSQLEVTFTDKENGTYYYRVFNYETVNGKEFVSGPSNAVGIEINGSTTSSNNSDDFYVDDNTLNAGECTRLHWEFDNIKAINVSFAKGFDPLGVQGGDNNNARVCPTVDTTYRAIVTDNNDDKTEYTVDIDVSGSDGCNDGKTDPYMEELFRADDETVQSNQTTTLRWHVECASEVYFTEGESNEGGVDGNSSKKTSAITGDTSYRFRVNGNVDYDGTYGDSFDRFQSFVVIEEE